MPRRPGRKRTAIKVRRSRANAVAERAVELGCKRGVMEEDGSYRVYDEDEEKLDELEADLAVRSIPIEREDQEQRGKRRGISR